MIREGTNMTVIVVKDGVIQGEIGFHGEITVEQPDGTAKVYDKGEKSSYHECKARRNYRIR